MSKKLYGKANSSESKSSKEEYSDGMKELIGNGQDFPFAYHLACKEGPRHHVYANAIILHALFKGIQEISNQLAVTLSPYDGEVVEVPMHHFTKLSSLPGNGIYPADLPVNLILSLAEGDEQRAEEMINALTEGAPHHVMANILTMHLAEAIMSLAKKQKQSGE